MNSFQIEAWVYIIIEQVENGKPDEDSRVELKSDWIDPIKAARQIAAHANTIHGEQILWIIGVDQGNHKVVGVNQNELSSWYQQVVSQFDEIAPSMKDLNVNYGDKTVVALLFETDRFPFIVKTKDGWLEVPWREGTSTRSAKRSELLKLLVPYVYLPSFEVLSGEAIVKQSNDGEKYWTVHLDLYIEPYNNTHSVIPFHRCKASIETQKSHTNVELGEIRFYPPVIFSESLSKTIESTQDELLAYGPGRLKFTGIAWLKNISDDVYEEDLQLNLHIQPVGTETPLLISIKMSKASIIEDRNALYKWTYE